MIRTPIRLYSQLKYVFVLVNSTLNIKFKISTVEGNLRSLFINPPLRFKKVLLVLKSCSDVCVCPPDGPSWGDGGDVGSLDGPGWGGDVRALVVIDGADEGNDGDVPDRSALLKMNIFVINCLLRYQALRTKLI